MAFTNPERTQYRECAIWVGCSFQGTPGQICLLIWVSNDFTMARGWFMGFAKKLGQTYLTEYHPLNPAELRAKTFSTFLFERSTLQAKPGNHNPTNLGLSHALSVGVGTSGG